MGRGAGAGLEKKSLLVIREAVSVLFFRRQRASGDRLQVILRGNNAPL